MTDTTSGEGTAHPSRVPEFTPPPPRSFSGVRVAQSLAFCLVLIFTIVCLFLHVLLTIVLLVCFPNYIV
jgi:hypothetical protein